PAIHNLMQQQNQKIEIAPNISAWKFSSSATSPSHVSAIATPRSCLFEISPALSYIIVCFRDSNIKCFYRENLQMLVDINLSTALTQSKANGGAVYGQPNYGSINNRNPS